MKVSATQASRPSRNFDSTETVLGQVLALLNRPVEFGEGLDASRFLISTEDPTGAHPHVRKFRQRENSWWANLDRPA